MTDVFGNGEQFGLVPAVVVGNRSDPPTTTAVLAAKFTAFKLRHQSQAIAACRLQRCPRNLLCDE